MKTMIVTGALVCLRATALATADDTEKARPTRTYTDEDLKRVSPRRGETGALSEPGTAADASRDDAPTRQRHEAYWRAQAERLQQQLSALRRRAEDLRARIEEARRRPDPPLGKSRRGADPVPGLERRLHAIEAEVRERQDALEERARRAGALPGWLR
jgi:chromosome segregation ATPase